MNDTSESAILQQVAAYYAAKLQTHGATSEGVDWKGPSSHALRHSQFLRLLAENFQSSIIDLGCGFGDFLRFVREAGYRGRFIGYDVAPTMIEKARELYGEGEDCQWHLGAEPEELADFAIASGIFNVKGQISDTAWSEYVYRTIDLLARAGRRGFAFNVLSLSSDPDRRRPDLYYADPTGMLAYCLARYGRSVALLQDYGLYEFTLIVRHTQSSA